MEREIILTSFIPTAEQYDRYFPLFRAVMGARLSKKAKDQGAFENETYNKGFYFMADAQPGYPCEVMDGDSCGVRHWTWVGHKDSGLRLAHYIKYNPNHKIFEQRRTLPLTSKVYDCKKSEYEAGGVGGAIVNSFITILKFCDKEYIWLNKGECLSGQTKCALIWSLLLLERAIPFSASGRHNSFFKATDLHEQCERVTADGATKEELAMLIPTRLTIGKNGLIQTEPNYKREMVVDFKAIASQAKNVQEAESLLRVQFMELMQKCETEAEVVRLEAYVRKLLSQDKKGKRLWIQELEKAIAEIEAARLKEVKDRLSGLILGGKK